LHQFDENGSRKILAEFLEKNWKREGLNSLLKKTWETGSTDQRHESGWQTKTAVKHACIEENTTTVNELVGLPWHEDQTQTHRSTRQISRDTAVTPSSVVWIIHRDVDLKSTYSFTKMFVFYFTR